MAIGTALSIRSGKVRDLDSNPIVQAKANALAHLIGFSFLWYECLDRVFRSSPLPILGVRDVPIMAVAIWLLIDRFGRTSRFRFTTFHYLMVLFGAFFGIGLIYADLFMVRQSGILNYIDWLRIMWTPFVFLLVIQEASTRHLFPWRTLVLWFVGAYSAMALLGLGQALNIPGVRDMSARIWNWKHFDGLMAGPPAPWQARGPAAHQNQYAQIITLGFALVPAVHRFVAKWWLTLAFAALLVAADFATYSRGGILALVGIGGISMAALFFQRKWATLGISLIAVVSLIGAFFAVIYAFDVERFTAVFEPKAVGKSNESISSWYDRDRMNALSAAKFAEYPIFGIRPAATGVDDLTSITYNSYAFEGLTAGGFFATPAYYGIGGIILMLVSFMCAWHPLLFRFRDSMVAMCPLWAGAVMFTFSASENVFFQPSAVVCFMVAMAFHLAINKKQIGLQSLALRLMGNTQEDVKKLRGEATDELSAPIQSA